MSLAIFKEKYNDLLGQLKGAAADLSFIKTKEKGFEALVFVSVITEYARMKDGVKQIHTPPSRVFLNMGPGKLKLDKAYRIEFNNGETFVFAADVEVFGLVAYKAQQPAGTLFEADIIVVPAQHVKDILYDFRGYPAPQHLHSAFECKHGKYHKGQLRELLGFRRHLSFLSSPKLPSPRNFLFGYGVQHSNPPIIVNLVRPRRFKFFDKETANLYDLQQLVIN
jgi:hypothetical protein